MDNSPGVMIGTYVYCVSDYFSLIDFLGKYFRSKTLSRFCSIDARNKSCVHCVKGRDYKLHLRLVHDARVTACSRTGIDAPNLT